MVTILISRPKLVAPGTMAYADSFLTLDQKASRGKSVPLPLKTAGFTLPFTVACWTSRFIARLSHGLGLISDFCSSVPRFASGFLQIPPHGGHPCHSLAVPGHRGPLGT